ncbi:MAG: hypothetical protein WC381_02290 [Kiritimatiellia bacterium]|jgi:hypothetical protein
MKPSIIAIIGISLALAFAPFAVAQDAALDAQARQDIAKRADAAKRLADDKAKALAEQQKRSAEQKTDLEARPGMAAPQADQPVSAAKVGGARPVPVTQNDLEKDKWRVAAGALYRRIGVQSFRTMGSYSAAYPIGAKSSNDRWTGPAGGLNDAGNRVYDDGYVKFDNFSDLDGGTWNWGYDRGRQVKGNQIEFTGVDRVWREASRQTVLTDAESGDDAAGRGGLMLEVERSMAKAGFVDYGLSLGLSRAQTFEASAYGMNTFNDNQAWATYNSRVSDSYNISGLGITPDSVPYKGNANDKGPVIDSTPMSRKSLGSELVSAGSYRAYNSVSESLDMDLSTLSLGVSVKGNYRRVYVVGSTGPTLNMVEKDASYEETLYESRNGGAPQVLKAWGDTSSGTECLFGYYVQAEVGVRIYRELHLGIFGRYDWLENVSGSVGPSRYEVNPSGGSLGGTVGIDF